MNKLDLKLNYNNAFEAGRQSAVVCPNCETLMELKERVLMGDKCRSWFCNECEVSFHLVSDVVWDDIYNGYHFMKKELKNNILTKKAYEIAAIEAQKEIDVLKIQLSNVADIHKNALSEIDKLKAELENKERLINRWISECGRKETLINFLNAECKKKAAQITEKQKQVRKLIVAIEEDRHLTLATTNLSPEFKEMQDIVHEYVNKIYDEVKKIIKRNFTDCAE